MPLRANTPGIPEQGIFSWNSPGDMRIFFFHTGNKWSAKSLCLHYPRIFAKDNYLNSQADEVTYINSQKTAYWSFYLANIYALFHSNIVLSALNNMTCFKLHCYCASIIICIWWHAFCDQISFGSRQFFFRPSPSSSIFIYLFLFIYLFFFHYLFFLPFHLVRHYQIKRKRGSKFISSLSVDRRFTFALGGCSPFIWFPLYSRKF